MRKKCLKLTVQLGSQRLIVGKNQRWFIQLCYDIGHRKCLTGTGDTEKGLKLIAFLKALHQLLDGLRLIAGRGIF